VNPADGEGGDAGEAKGGGENPPPEPLSSNGTGGGEPNGHGKNGHGAPPPTTRSRWPMTNEDQSCFGCVALILIVIVSLLFWLFIYWRNADEFNTSRVPVLGREHTLAGLSERHIPDAAA